jgi:hypothetical protein
MRNSQVLPLRDDPKIQASRSSSIAARITHHLAGGNDSLSGACGRRHYP